ncbi:MAG: crossover junction endodeoxyribonuclease RuvC [Phycisphaerales bacterium]|jgi:crossover junction endodeoxyribonuclease RuvC|nr:crossover junction endodeoxyribonuclease RuvC [Phycisphaerales bacterium]
MRVLGIDPGLRIAGYGCVEFTTNSSEIKLIEAGAIRMKTKETISFRITQLYDGINEIITDLNPDILAVETIFTHSKQVSTATIMGHARGVILLAGQKASIPLVELTPAEIKKAVSGNGRATKEQVQLSVMTFLGLKKAPEPLDVSDALAIAITASVRI